MTSVCVNRFSTNQPVWNRLWLCADVRGVETSEHPKTWSIRPEQPMPRFSLGICYVPTDVELADLL
jgi:hypothetical protein